MTAQGRITAANVRPGTRLIVAERDGRIGATNRKTGIIAEVTEVTSEMTRTGRRALRRYCITTDRGTLNLSPATTVTLAPEPKAAPAAKKAAPKTAAKKAAPKAAAEDAKAAAPERAARLGDAAAARLAAVPEARRDAILAAVPVGYDVVWPKASWTTLKANDAADADASKWAILCNAHGVVRAIPSSTSAVEEGKRANMAVWCPGCAAAAKAAAKAAKKKA